MWIWVIVCDGPNRAISMATSVVRDRLSPPGPLLTHFLPWPWKQRCYSDCIYTNNHGNQRDVSTSSCWFSPLAHQTRVAG